MSMLLVAKNLEEILDKLDFTESIITEINWENNLFDLALSVDYWWELDDDPSTVKGYGTKILKIVFSDCLKADFTNSLNLVQLPKSEIHADSWFTIVSFRESQEEAMDIDYRKLDIQHGEIITLDYSKPWLSVICREIRVYRIR